MPLSPLPQSPVAVPSSTFPLLEADFPAMAEVRRWVVGQARGVDALRRLGWYMRVVSLMVLQPLTLLLGMMGGLSLAALLAAVAWAVATRVLEPEPGSEGGLNSEGLLSLATGALWLVLAPWLCRGVFRAWKVMVVWQRRRLLVDVHNATQQPPLSRPPAVDPARQGRKRWAVAAGAAAMMALPAFVPNVFQIPCERRAEEADRGLQSLATAQRNFFGRQGHYATLPQLLASQDLAVDPNTGALHYLFVVNLGSGYTALAVDKRAPVNRTHPLDAWVITASNSTPQRYLKACRE